LPELDNDAARAFAGDPVDASGVDAEKSQEHLGLANIDLWLIRTRSSPADKLGFGRQLRQFRKLIGGIGAIGGYIPDAVAVVQPLPGTCLIEDPCPVRGVFIAKPEPTVAERAQGGGTE
jgi:hypothetical protein